MYQYGKSVEQNTNTAVELFTRAARQVSSADHEPLA
jgi:TPR repeat protein